jgi:hypothetical protein
MAVDVIFTPWPFYTKKITLFASSSVWGRRLPTECTAAFRDLLYEPRFIFPLSSPEANHVKRCERPLSPKGGTMGEKCPIKFSHTIVTSTQTCDMGPTALLPLRKKACLGFFSSQKIRRLRPGLYPRVTRDKHANH